MYKALIVDDEVDMWFLLSGVLRANKIKSNFVNNLTAARHSLEKEVPRILFLDNHLPDGFGINFIKYVKANYPETKIVMITGYTEDASRKKAFKEGADLFISKPFNNDVINTAIKTILSSSPQTVA